MPQLKGTMGKTKPTPNPLVSLLQTAIEISSTTLEFKDGSKDNFATTLMSSMLFEASKTTIGLHSGLQAQGLNLDGNNGTSVHLKQSHRSPSYGSSMDGPIRPNQSIDDELLFHPFDEVTVINPQDFARERGIELDLSDGFGGNVKVPLSEEENALQDSPNAESSQHVSEHSKGIPTADRHPNTAPSRPIVVKSAYNGVMQLKEDVSTNDANAVQGSLQPGQEVGVKIKKVKPISRLEFEEQCDRLGLREASGVVASISGGPDSMAMALLLAEYCLKTSIPLLCVTIDHAMRPEAPAEALVTQTWLHALGIPHTIVRVEWPNDTVPTHGVQSKARDARYEAVTKIAQELQNRISQLMVHSSKYEDDQPQSTANSAGGRTQRTTRGSPNSTSMNDLDPKLPPPNIHVLMAHNADDNVETFWLRMAGCSGLYGLAGIAEKRVLSPGVFLSRPVLAFSKLRLYATLIAANQPWASDPSNAKLLYKRNQVRHTLDSLYSLSSASSSISPASKRNNSDVTPLQRINERQHDDLNSVTATAPDAFSEALRRFTSTPSPSDSPLIDNSVSLEDMTRLQHNFSKSRFLLDSITHRFCVDYISVSKRYGYVVVPTQALLQLPETFILRVLDTVFAHVSGDSTPMRLKSVKGCLKKIRAASETMDVLPEEDNSAGFEPLDAASPLAHAHERRDSRANDRSSSSRPTKSSGPDSSQPMSSFCFHRCIIIQSPRRLTIAMQNMPNAPAALVKGKTPLPPYRADCLLPLGASNTIHWLSSWRITYEPNEMGHSLFDRQDGVLPTPLPQQLYVRQLQSFDLPILRRLGKSFTSWSTRLNKHVLLSLPVIVDENSNIVHFSFLMPSTEGRTIASLSDGPGIATHQMRSTVERFARFRVKSEPSNHVAQLPPSSFIGYAQIAENSPL